MRCQTCNPGPGKFEAEPVETFLAFRAWLSGAADEEGTDWAFVRFPLTLDADDIADARDAGYCASCIDAAGHGLYGIGLEISEGGFVYGYPFKTRAEYESAVTYLRWCEARAEREEA
jgi:hypothetical protein